jgi:hypothetical protein
MSNLSIPKISAKELGIEDAWVVKTIVSAIRALTPKQKQRVVVALRSDNPWIVGVDAYYYLVKEGVPSLAALAMFGVPATPKTTRLDDARWPKCRPDEAAWDRMYEATYRELPSALQFCKASHLPAIRKALVRKQARPAAECSLQLDNLF